jgi:hypothetical protein
MKNSQPPSPPKTNELQAQIETLVAALKQAGANIPGVFRGFCLLARGWKSDPEEFRGRLVRAGLRPSRASELKTLLSATELRDGFIRRETSWQKSLKAARAWLHAQEGFDPLHELAATLVGIMHRQGIMRIHHPLGTIHLREQGSALADCLPRGSATTDVLEP